MTSGTITLDIDNLTEGAALYHVYPGQSRPQTAHVQLDGGGRVTADWNGEIGNAVPMDVWNGRTLRWAVSPYLSGPALAEALASPEVAALLEAVAAGHDEEWNGSNHVGTLTPEAREASERLGELLDRLADDANLAELSDDEDE